MNTMTINISLPTEMYLEAKKTVKTRRYTSISELIRDAVRRLMYSNITENGFTKEFEQETLEAIREADKGNVVEWNGKGSFVDFVLREGAKKYGEDSFSRKVLSRLGKDLGKKSAITR